MEHRLDAELDREEDCPPDWWDGRKHTVDYYEMKDWLAEQEAWLADFEAWFYGDEREYCPRNNELTAQDIETDQECCEDCR